MIGAFILVGVLSFCFGFLAGYINRGSDLSRYEGYLATPDTDAVNEFTKLGRDALDNGQGVILDQDECVFNTCPHEDRCRKMRCCLNPHHD